MYTKIHKTNGNSNTVGGIPSDANSADQKSLYNAKFRSSHLSEYCLNLKHKPFLSNIKPSDRAILHKKYAKGWGEGGTS